MNKDKIFTGAEIKALREKKEMTQAQFAEVLGFSSYNRISELENEKIKPSKQINKILQMIEKNSIHS